MEIIPRPRSCFLCIGNRSFKGFRLSFIRTVGCKTSCIWSQISSVRLIDDSLTNRKERTKIGNNYSSWKHPVWSTTRIDFRSTTFLIFIINVKEYFITSFTDKNNFSCVSIFINCTIFYNCNYFLGYLIR